MSVFFFHKRSQIAIENRFLKCQRFLLPGSKLLTTAADSLENGLGLNFKGNRKCVQTGANITTTI